MVSWKSLTSPAPSLDVPGLETVDLADKDMERRILPWICITYLLSKSNTLQKDLLPSLRHTHIPEVYLDRVNLGNARTPNNDTPDDNIVTQLNLTGQRYNVAVALFFVPYVLMEFPSNILLKHFSPNRWISRIMVSWGIVTICTAAVPTYGGLLAVRIFLGLTEAGFFPGVMRCHDVPVLLVQARGACHAHGHFCVVCRCCRCLPRRYLS